MGGWGWLVIVLLGLILLAAVALYFGRLKLAKTSRAIAPLFESALRDLNSHTEYLSNSLFLEWKTRQDLAIKALEQYDQRMAEVLPDSEGKELNSLYLELFAAAQDTKGFNQRFMERRLQEDRARFDKVEAHPLTDRQREAIVTDEDTTIVVAGAGTGKTSVIVGKVDYLLRHQLAKPSQMLVMAYNTAAAGELRQRMSQLGVSDEVTVKTFHSFGYSILGEAEGEKRPISPLASDQRLKYDFFRTTLLGLMKSPEHKEALELLFTDQLDEEDEVSESLEEATSKAMQIALTRAKGFYCLAGMRLKSRQEVKIANWLTLKGIRWEYERPYSFNLATAQSRNYQPDFYLPDYEIYIEHFGIDHNGLTAPGVDPVKYTDQMIWKRSIHQQNQTTLVETYSYDDTDGLLTRRLAEKLIRHGVKTRELAKEELDRLVNDNNREFSKFFRVLEQFLNLYRGSVRTWDQVVDSAQSERDQTFLKIMGEIVKAYEGRLIDEGSIDFDDMINQARAAIQKGEVDAPYTHIIIDEFQDITHNRFGLVQDVRGRVKQGRVFAVGDDWQSIYRFNGSDVSITTRLPDFAGAVARVDLDQTFRYPQSLLDASAKFITKNPNQLKKRLHSKISELRAKPITVMTTHADSNAHAIRTALDDIHTSKAFGLKVSVFILARYNNSIPADLVQLQREYELKGLLIQAMTAHRSKGLEADYVIILDLNSGGFPSGASDDPVMRMVLSAGDEFPFAEERRLFYVAMTRARQCAYLLAPPERASIFLEEDILSKDYERFVEVNGELAHRHTCPVCSGKTIRKKNGQYGDFWACANFPLCEGKLPTCTQCNEGALVPKGKQSECDTCNAVQRLCPRCNSGTLVERTGVNGPFIGCTNFRSLGCRYTEDLPSIRPASSSTYVQPY